MLNFGQVDVEVQVLNGAHVFLDGEIALVRVVNLLYVLKKKHMIRATIHTCIHTYIHTYTSSTYLISLCISMDCIDWASLDCTVYVVIIFLVCIHEYITCIHTFEIIRA
jgi:hypothetical protein